MSKTDAQLEEKEEGRRLRATTMTVKLGASALPWAVARVVRAEAAAVARVMAAARPCPRPSNTGRPSWRRPESTWYPNG